MKGWGALRRGIEATPTIPAIIKASQALAAARRFSDKAAKRHMAGRARDYREWVAERLRENAGPLFKLLKGSVLEDIQRAQQELHSGSLSQPPRFVQNCSLLVMTRILTRNEHYA